MLPDTLEIEMGVPPAPIRARTLDDDFSLPSRMTLGTLRYTSPLMLSALKSALISVLNPISIEPLTLLI